MRPNVTEDISKPFSDSRGILSNFDKLWPEPERSRMPGPGFNTVEICHGLRMITLENELLRIQLLPEAGAKIWQITYLPLNVDLLWNNPHIRPARHAIDACYDDVWSGGWDELFPNDEETTIRGEQYRDHGELWGAAWDAEAFTRADEVGVTLRLRTPISAITVEKTITLRQGSAQLHFSHRFTNRGTAAFPFLWKLHPAMRVTPQHRIDMPRMRVVREPDFPGTPSEAPAGRTGEQFLPLGILCRVGPCL